MRGFTFQWTTIDPNKHPLSRMRRLLMTMSTNRKKNTTNGTNYRKPLISAIPMAMVCLLLCGDVGLPFHFEKTYCSDKLWLHSYCVCSSINRLSDHGRMEDSRCFAALLVGSRRIKHHIYNGTSRRCGGVGSRTNAIGMSGTGIIPFVKEHIRLTQRFLFFLSPLLALNHLFASV